MTVRSLTFADFAPRLGKPFTVQAQNGTIQLTLAQAKELPRSMREGGSFWLEFLGPAQRPLGQGTYRFMIDNRPFEIFIVPIGQAEGQLRYEAVFY